MKAILQDTSSLLLNRLIHVKEINTLTLDDCIHFHDGYEISLILSGKGIRVVGDNIEDFNKNDLVFIGPNLPHVTYNHYTETFEEIPPAYFYALVIYFYPNWFTSDLVSSSEFIKMNKFIEEMKRGIVISREDIKKKVIKLLLELRHSKGPDKMIKLWRILNIVSESGEYRHLASESYSKYCPKKDSDRLNSVFRYVIENYSDPISLVDVSSLINMTPSAFCKFFKSKTGKTFTEYVNEVRIGQACKLLYNVDKNISDICYHCGFNNLTSFIKNFKRFKNKTPTEYRKILNSELVSRKKGNVKSKMRVTSSYNSVQAKL